MNYVLHYIDSSQELWSRQRCNESSEEAVMAYNLRKNSQKDYKQLADIQLPRPGRPCVPADKVNIVDSKNDGVKILFVGYREEYNEWWNDLVHLPPQV